MANSQQTAPVVSIATGAPWGRANARRGRSYHDDAVAFAQQFPIGSQLTSTDLGNWAQQHGLLTIPASKYDPEWLGYLQARGLIRDRIRKAGSHPRMFETEIGTTFTIVRIAGETWRVTAAQEAMRQADPLGEADSVLMAKKRHFQYLAQGAFLAGTPVARFLADEMYHAIEDAARDLTARRQQVIDRANRAQALIEAEIQRNQTPALPSPE